MNTKEQTPTTEELGATPAEVEQETVVEETKDSSHEDITEALAPLDEEEVEEVEEVEEEEEDVAEEVKEEKKEEPVEETPTDFIAEAKKLYPDKEFKTDSDVYQAVLVEQAELRSYKEDNDAANQRVMEVLTDQPEVGEIIKELAKGATFPEALALHVDMDAMTPQEGEPDHKAWKEAKAKRKEQAEQLKSIQDEVDKNQVLSGKNLEKFRTDKDMTEEEVTAFTSAAHEVIGDIYNGLITDDFLTFMYKGLNYDDAIAEGRKQGEIKGKNKNIDLKKAKAKKGDGLPGIKSQGQPEKAKKDPVAEAFVNFQNKRNRF